MIPNLFCNIVQNVQSPRSKVESKLALDTGPWTLDLLRCFAFRFTSQELFVLTAFYPFQNLRHAPDRKRMAKTGGDYVGPKTVEGFGVVVLLEVAGLSEE